MRVCHIYADLVSAYHENPWDLPAYPSLAHEFAFRSSGHRRERDWRVQHVPADSWTWCHSGQKWLARALWAGEWMVAALIRSLVCTELEGSYWLERLVQSAPEWLAYSGMSRNLRHLDEGGLLG